MPVLSALARAGLRRRRPLVGLAVVLALGLGVALASLEAARRTEDAYPAYLRRAAVNELVVNPSLITDRAEEIIASTPGVVSFASDSLMTAGYGTDDATAAEVDNAVAQVRMSRNGRYIDRDRPVVRSGRMIRTGPEAFVNEEMAAALHLRVGSVLPLAFYPTFGDGEEAGPATPLGRVDVTVVGIGVFADEVLVDGLYPRQRALVTADVGAPYDCSFVQPDPTDQRSPEELIPVIVPPNCSMSYRYYSLEIEGGAGGVRQVSDALAASFSEENTRLPASFREAGIGFEVIPTVTADEAARVQRSLEPAVRSLQLFALASGIATVVLALLGAARIARRDQHEIRVWRDLGVGQVLRAAGVAAPLALAVLAGTAGSLVVGWLSSGIGPVASVRTLEPEGRLGLSTGAVLLVLGPATAVVLGGLVLVGMVASRPRIRPARTGVAPSRARGRLTDPPRTLGIRAAMGGAGSRALLGASVTVVTAVLATLVFSSSLGGLVSHPARFGWSFDIAATLNFGYGGSTDPAAVATTLDRPEVEHWGTAVMASLTIDGESVPFVAARSGFDAMPLPVVKGELPVAGDEVALGSLTARRLGLEVGDRTTIQLPFGRREATVTGLVVLPPVGPLQSDRSSLGNGALLSRQFLDRVLAQDEEGADAAPGERGDAQAGLVAIDLRPGVDRSRFLDSIADQMATWDESGSAPFVYPEAIRPATVANVAAMRAVPVLLAGMLALTMALGLALAVAVAARSRRRELALLRSLGCIGRQLRATIRWQALTVVGVGLLGGIPFGLAVGRVTYGAFAGGLGVRPEPDVSLGWLLLLIGGSVATGLLAAVGPGRGAARVCPGAVLREE